MLIIPAIDIKDGMCVRLTQGRAEEVKVYSTDPVLVALDWQKKGAEFLHVVDLDAAFSGEPRNVTIIERMAKVLEIPFEVGGGVRDLQAVERFLAQGANRVVIGTAALEDAGFLREACRRFPDSIAVGIDAKNGLVAVKGWTEVCEERALDFAKRLEGIGVRAIIFTDIKRDGMLSGPNIWAIREMAEAVDIPIIASGGISSMADVKAIMALEEYGVEGMIIGKALYEGTLDLRKALALVRRSDC